VYLLAGLTVPAGALGAYPSIRHLAGDPPDESGFVITSPQGVRVFVDAVSVPEDLAAALQDPRSVLVVTSRVPERRAERLAEGFKGQRLVAAAGKVESGDVRVETLAAGAAGSGGDPLGTGAVVAVIEVGGLRVVVAGDCAGAQPTPELVRQLGRPDVLAMAFDPARSEAEAVSRKAYRERGYSDVEPVNERAFRTLAQLRPRLLIPTHLSSRTAVGLLARIHPAEIARRAELTLAPEVLARGPRVVFTGASARLAARAGIAPSTEL
jgi:hypothetical protein